MDLNKGMSMKKRYLVLAFIIPFVIGSGLVIGDDEQV